MVAVADTAAAQTSVEETLGKRGISRQTPATQVLDNTFSGLRDFESKSYAPPTNGRSRLLDGTVIQVAGTTSVSGDPIVSEIEVRGLKVSVDALGVVAIRVNGDRRLSALVAGGLKHVRAGDLEISLDDRVDVAMWIDEGGEWCGVVQSASGAIPEPLARITKRWTRLRVPIPAKAE
jgi:hypothetical protein